MAKTNERFDIAFEAKGFSELTRILRDRQTGVCYLFHQVGAVGGLTVLLDADGKPVVEAPAG